MEWWKKAEGHISPQEGNERVRVNVTIDRDHFVNVMAKGHYHNVEYNKLFITIQNSSLVYYTFPLISTKKLNSLQTLKIPSLR